MSVVDVVQPRDKRTEKSTSKLTKGDRDETPPSGSRLKVDEPATEGSHCHTRCEGHRPTDRRHPLYSHSAKHRRRTKARCVSPRKPRSAGNPWDPPSLSRRPTRWCTDTLPQRSTPACARGGARRRGTAVRVRRPFAAGTYHGTSGPASTPPRTSRSDAEDKGQTSQHPRVSVLKTSERPQDKSSS